MHKIKSFTARTVLVPLSTPHKTASGEIQASPLILVDVLTDSGITGHSIIFTYTPAALKPCAELLQNIGELICGEVLTPAEIEQQLSKRFRLLGTQGLVGMALAGIDMALWDAHARGCNLSLVSMLGGTAKPIKAYAPIGYDGVQGCANAAKQWADEGFLGMKAKIGYPTVKEDIEVCQAIRKAAGSDVAIMVDYNQSLTPEEARQRISVLDAEGLTWVEEPTLAHDYIGHAAVTQAVQTPIQTGENWWGTLDMSHALDADASDLVMLDVMKIGGVTGWLRAAAAAHNRQRLVSSHLWPEVSAQLLSCTPTAHWLEYADWWNPILANPVTVEHGYVTAGDEPGSGINWNEKAVQQYAV